MKRQNARSQRRDRIRGMIMTAAFAAAGLMLIGAFAWVSGGSDAREASSIDSDQPLVTVYKRPNCTCCTKWVSHLRESGFAVKVRSVASTTATPFRLGVPAALQSCHTAEIGDYWIEGHVPADLIARLLEEQPSDIEGLAVPGMPVGPPGMEGPDPQTYSVIAVDAEANETVYATREGAHAPQ